MEKVILLRSVILLILFIHLASLAATQTAYGGSFSMLRWISLIALFGFGGLNWIVSGQRSLRLKSVNTRVLIYLALWGLTVVDAEYPLFSSYRWVAHAMIVVATLVFLPRILRVQDVNKLLWALKLTVAAILVVSYFRPAPLTVLDVASMYRGILGNANSLGHMAAVSCLLFLHGFITQKGRPLRLFQGAMVGLAGMLLIRSGARSSVAAFAGSSLVFYVFYKSHISRYAMSHYALLAIAGAAVALVVLPNLPESMMTFAMKHENEIKSQHAVESESAVDIITFTRLPLWERQWASFEERPLLGWGFGLDKDTDLSNWNGEWTAKGFSGRDPVNDIMYSLESGGIVGLSTYLFMLSLILKAWISAPVRSMFDADLRRPGHELLASAYEAWKVFYCLAVLLMVLFELDDTALAAGNFFAALFWLSLGLIMWLYGALTYSLRRPARMRSSLRSHAAVLRAG